MSVIAPSAGSAESVQSPCRRKPNPWRRGRQKGGPMGDALPADGLDALRAQLRPVEIMRLIETTARWVDPETFRLLPLWYPEHARRAYLYKKNWSERLTNTNKQSGHREDKREANVYASKA